MILPCPTASSCGARRGEEPFRAKEVQQWKQIGTGPKDAGAARGVNEDEGISPTIVGGLYVDMLIGWLIDWLIGWLVDWLIDWLWDLIIYSGVCLSFSFIKWLFVFSYTYIYLCDCFY